MGYIGVDISNPDALPKKLGLVLTTDCGKTWFIGYLTHPVDTFKLEYRNWLYVSPTTIYVLADTMVQLGYNGLNAVFNYMAIILKSTDGGKTWQRIQINDKWRTTPSTWLSMSDSLHGVFVQFPSENEPTETTDQIYYTDDGWKTWKKLNTHTEQLACRLIYFENPGKIVAYAWGYENLYVTNDLGKTWTKKHIFFADSGLRPSTISYDVQFINSNIFFYRCSKTLPNNMGYHTILAKTTNAGDTWEIIREGIGFVNILLYPSNYINDSTFYIFDDGQPYFTSDNGKTWIRKYNAFFDNQEEAIDQRYHVNDKRILGVTLKRLLEFKGEYTLLPPTIVEPKATFNVPLDLTLKWTPIEGAESYELQVVEQKGFLVDEPWNAPPAPNFDSTLFAHKIFDSSVTSYTLENTSYFKTYTCRMRAISKDYTSPWRARYFVTIQEPNSVENCYDALQSTLILKRDNWDNFNSLEQFIPYTLYNILGNEICTQCANDIFNSIYSGIYFIKSQNKLLKVILY